MTELLERLSSAIELGKRAGANGSGTKPTNIYVLAEQAANRLAELEAENARLREMLHHPPLCPHDESRRQELRRRIDARQPIEDRGLVRPYLEKWRQDDDDELAHLDHRATLARLSGDTVKADVGERG